MAPTRAWYTKIDGYFQGSGFKRSKVNILYKKQNDDILLVCMYVDDLTYIGSSSNLNDSFKVSMMSEFEMKDLGLMHYFLRMDMH